MRQLFGMLPVLSGVVLLVGLFREFLPRNLLLSIFSGRAVADAFFGSCFGGIMAGNPVNSYVIGDMLMGLGVGLSAVTALMLSWVNVGLVQLPAEMAALGPKFALLRHTAAFFLSVPIAVAIVLLVGVHI